MTRIVWNRALKDERKPLINRALMPYCVGSSFKLAVAAAALEQGIPPSFSVDCVGGTTVAGRIFYCHNHAGHRQTNLRRAIEQSCNPYFIKLGQKAGAQALLGMAQALGFGQETVLAEGITARQGTLPSLEELSSPHELANFSFGQGKLTATPVQVAAMVSAVANGGLAVSPKLVLGSTTDGSTLEPQQQTAPGAGVQREDRADFAGGHDWSGRAGQCDDGKATAGRSGRKNRLGADRYFG